MDLPTAFDAASAHLLIGQIRQHLAEKGVTDFRNPPAEPTTCCGRGCNGCVWEGYFAALAYWQEQALETTS